MRQFIESVDDGTFFKRSLRFALRAFAGLLSVTLLLAPIGVLIGDDDFGGGVGIALLVGFFISVIPVILITIARADSIGDVENDLGSPAVPVVAILLKWSAEVSAVTIFAMGTLGLLGLAFGASAGVLDDYLPMAYQLQTSDGLEFFLLLLMGQGAVFVYAFVTLLSGHVVAESFGALIRIADNS